MDSEELNYILSLGSIESVCRVCLLEQGCISILASTIQNMAEINIQEVFETCADTHVQENDKLPQYICSNCFSCLLKTNEFIMKCKRSTSLLEYVKLQWEAEDKPSLEESHVFNNLCEPIDTNSKDNVTECYKSVYEDNKNTIKLEISTCDISRTESTSTSDYVITCNVCSQACESRYDLKCHMHSHSKKKSYKCKTCFKVFSTTSHLKRHLMIHSGEKPYICSVCHGKFSDKHGLKRHNLVHTGDKPFPCNICGKTFAQLNNLNRHKRYHSGAKPYSCEYCEKKFVEKVHLTVHVRIHTGETPYICSVCDVGFHAATTLKKHTRTHQKCSLKTHLGKHEGVRPFACDVCPKAFMYNQGLKRHKLVHVDVKTISTQH